MILQQAGLSAQLDSFEDEAKVHLYPSSEDAAVHTTNTTTSRSASNEFEITSAAPIEHVNGLTEWGGWGIRYNLRGETGYVAKNGPAVRIEVKTKGGTGKKVYVFSCEDAVKVGEILGD